MTDDDARGEAPEVAHYFLLAVAMLMILVALVVSARPVTLANLPDVVPVAAIPDQALAERLVDESGYSAYLVPHSRVRPAFVAAAGNGSYAAGPIALGWSVRQIGFLGLPMFATREIGPVLYRTQGDRYRAWPIADEGLATLRARYGEGFGRGVLYRLWLTSWGLIAVVAVALFGWLELRRQTRRRERLGLI